MPVGKKAIETCSGGVRISGIALGAFLFSLFVAAPAGAELVVSQLIVEFRPGAPRAADIEIFNNSDERAYAVIEPREVLNAGTLREEPFTAPDPAKLGLIASPARIIFEPQQRRRLRIAAIGAAGTRERVYRVIVKPVTGDVSGSESGLKLLVGYDLLVLVRPPVVRNAVRAERNGTELALTNEGNVTRKARIAARSRQSGFMPAQAGNKRSRARREERIACAPRTDGRTLNSKSRSA